jgi:hypothetical protein
MIPFILAAVGGYLIGDSIGEDIDSKIPKFADGGRIKKLKDAYEKEEDPDIKKRYAMKIAQLEREMLQAGFTEKEKEIASKKPIIVEMEGKKGYWDSDKMTFTPFSTSTSTFDSANLTDKDKIAQTVGNDKILSYWYFKNGNVIERDGNTQRFYTHRIPAKFKKMNDDEYRLLEEDLRKKRDDKNRDGAIDWLKNMVKNRYGGEDVELVILNKYADGGMMAKGGVLSLKDKIRLREIERQIKEEEKTIKEFEEDDTETTYDRFGNPSAPSFNQQVVISAENNLERLQEERKNLLKGKKMADGGMMAKG